MNDKVKQAIFVRAALLETEAVAQALPPSPERRALIAAQRRLHARLYALLMLAEDIAPGVTDIVATEDSGGDNKNVSFAPGVDPHVQRAA